MRSNVMFAALAFCLALPVCSGQITPAPLPVNESPGAGTPSNRNVDDLPPLPRCTVSLIGGTVTKLDPIHDRLSVRAFGGRDVKIDFDVRTQIIWEEKPVSSREIRPGTRIYADTILKDGRIFAKTLRIATRPALGEASGQVTSFDPTTGVLRVRDALSAEPFTAHVNSQTAIQTGNEAASQSQLVAGTLVRIAFRSGSERMDAQKISILAKPGETFTFTGRITFVDFRAGYVAVADQSEAGTHEVTIDQLPASARQRLREGMDVIVNAQFNGHEYQARAIDPAPARPQ